jgi:hypothetical protein
LTSYFPGRLWERGSHEMQIGPYLQFNFCQNIHLLTENGRLEWIQNDLNENNDGTKSREALPNCRQICSK